MKEAESANKWFYEDHGQRNGPVSESEIVRLIKSGVVSRGSQVWMQGFSGWRSMEATELSRYVDSSVPPPLSGEHVNNTMAWVMALLPLFGGVSNFISRIWFMGIMRGSYGGQLFGLLLWVALFAFYIWLSRTDEKRIKDAGHNYDKISTWAWLVPPVYLYQRAKALDQNLLYFFVWIGCAVLSLLV